MLALAWARVLDYFAWLVAIVIPTSYFQTWCETDATVDFFKNCGGDICRSYAGGTQVSVDKLG